MDAGIIDAMAENMRSRMLTMGDSVVKISPRLVGRFADHCRLSGAGAIDGLLPAERQRADAERRSPGAAAQPWTGRTGVEGDESTNHQLYPRQSAGDDRGRDRHLAGVLALWAELDSLLLAVLVGFSVLIPYIGAFVVTIPVVGVALFQFGAGTDSGAASRCI